MIAIPKNASAARALEVISGAVLGNYSESMGDQLIPVGVQNDGRSGSSSTIARDREYFMINVDGNRSLTRLPSDMYFVLRQDAGLAHLGHQGCVAVVV